MAPGGAGAGPLGIVAGAGRLPRLIVDACKQAGRPVFVVALDGFAEPGLVEGVPHRWVNLAAAAGAFPTLRQAGVGEVVLAGAVRRPSLAELRPDWRSLRFLARVAGRALGDDGLLKAVVAEIESEGFRVLSVPDVLAEATAPTGPLGRHVPDVEARSDIARGIAVAVALGAADVGQAVVVQQGIVLGVEAVEGTDALLARCAALRRAGPGGDLVKIAKPGQERRADLPTIGPETVRNAAAAGLRGVAIEAGATLVVDAGLVAQAADQLGVFVIGVDRDG
ncbi:MAG: UDP-2,3-diacylglucosamine diphosphatase LpxI [Alphaproteobacteria bacterium]|nr:UDP-2,3-diacylglucosamine diphosphatase LpxI [Alphaproteobacteria bacterium]